MSEHNNHKQHFLFINSKDRNIGLDSENTFSFKTYLNSDNISGAVINSSNIYKNVIKIELQSIIIPDFYLDLKTIHFLRNNSLLTSTIDTDDSRNIRCPTLNNTQYICVTLETDSFNLKDTVCGTNRAISNATFIMTQEDRTISTKNNSGYYTLVSNKLVEIGNINNSILADTQNKLLFFKNLGDISLNLNKNTVHNINLSITDPLGKPLKYLNDSLCIHKITYNSSGADSKNRLLIEFFDYFSSEEYSLGDTLSISFLNKDELVDDSLKSLEWVNELITFLNTRNNDKHPIIIGHFGDSENVPISTSNLFKGIYIPLDFNYLSDTETTSSNIFKTNSMGMPPGTTSSIEFINKTKNRLINLDKQILVSLKLTIE